MDLIWFLVALVMIAIVISVLWQVFGVGKLVAPMTPTQRMLVALLGLLLIIALLWWFVTRSGLVAGF